MKTNIATHMIENYNLGELLSDEQFYAVETAFEDLLSAIVDICDSDEKISRDLYDLFEIE